MLAELSPRSRLIVVRLREGKSYSDIGEELNVSKQAVHKVGYAALQSLREKLEAGGFSGIDSKGFLKSARRDSRAKRDSLPQAARRAEQGDGNPAG